MGNRIFQRSDDAGWTADTVAAVLTPRRADCDRPAAVMLAVDHLDLACLLEARLHRCGLAVTTVHDGHEALRTANRERPAAIVLRQSLPGGLGGGAVLAALRDNPRTRGTPVIVLLAPPGGPCAEAHWRRRGASTVHRAPLDTTRLVKEVVRLATPDSWGNENG